MNKERRLYKRIFFSAQDGPIAAFSYPDSDRETLMSTIMDLSAGGMGMSIKKIDGIINMGEHLILRRIKDVEALNEVVNIETNIRWIQDYSNFKHILFGCEFLDISWGARVQIQDFINKWIHRY